MRFPSLVLGGLLVAGSAAAQSADTTKLTAGLGLVTTSGNTNVTTFNFGNSFSYIAHPWVLSEAASMIYGSSHDTVNNDQYHLLLRVDYALHDGLSAYLYGGFDRDRFAGIVSRYQEAVGIAWKVVEKPADLLTLETGLGENQQRDVGSGSTTSFSACRSAKTPRPSLRSRSTACAVASAWSR